VRIHCTSPPEKPSSLRTDGRAMATIVRSRTATKEAQHNSTSANVFLPPPSDTILSSDTLASQSTPSIRDTSVELSLNRLSLTMVSDCI
jgi:hypothetical protein